MGTLDPLNLDNAPEIEPVTEVAEELGDQGPELKTPKSPRAIARSRRIRSIKTSWKIYRSSVIGLIGLGVLVFFVLIAVFAPLLAPESGTQISKTVSVNPHFSPPVSGFPLGTDRFGRSMLTMLIWGSRISLLVGFMATIGTMVIGAAVGIAAGFFGGRTDGILMRITDFFLVIPWLALALVLAAILRPSLWNTIIVIAVTTWAFTARVVRSQALTVKSRPYVERAKALGASNWHVITRHILPNTFPIIFSQTILIAAGAILTESTLSFLGLGPPDSPSWGTLLETGFGDGAITTGSWWLIIPPGLCIMFVTLALTMIGYAFDQILNPRLRER